MQLLGFGDAADPGIEALQRALLTLSQDAFRPDVNPGPINGALTDQTMIAVTNAMDILGARAELPMWTRITVQGALLIGATTQTAKDAVTNAAPFLAAAALAGALAVQPAPGGGIFVPTQSFFGTLPGMVLILIGLGIGFKLFTSRGKQHVDG